jgi:hypothetical protein
MSNVMSFHSLVSLNKTHLTEDGSENQGLDETEKNHVGSEFTMILSA